MHTDLCPDQARPADIGGQTCLLGKEQRKLESPIAIVGVGLRMPGGINDLDSLWRMLLEGRSAVGGVPPDRWNQERFYHTDASASGRLASRWGGFVRRAKEFDAAFWGISPREAARMDPQQRWLLEIAWEAIEDAGVRPNDLRGQRVGVYVGASSHDYGTAQLEDLLRLDVHSNTGGASSILANRLSYLLDLRGPSLVVDTACSSALVAIAMAVDAIRSGVCRAALTGGVNSLFLPNSGVGFSKAGMLSPTGQCLAFDARANGYVRSEGAGLLLLKPLADAVADGDSIYAVIRGAAINSDGRTSSLTVPSAAGQADMLREAYRNAGVNPLDVSYVEAHGTGTPVGDPIEANALSQVLSQHRGQDHPLLIGSIKANLGHLESASGIAGMLKAVLVLQRGVIPGQANFESLNKHIDGNELRLRVVRQNSPLSVPAGTPPIVGVNSFGFGGTNAHVVLAAAPVAERPSVAAGQFAAQSQSTSQTQSTSQAQNAPRVLADRPHVLPISAHDAAALRLTAQSYLRTLSELSGALPDFCSSAGDRRQHQSHRLVVVGLDAEQLSAGLQDWLAATAISNNQLTAGKQWVYGEAVQGATSQAINSRKTTAETTEPSEACGPTMVFTGQGCQWTGMGRTLFEREPSFRETLFEIDEIFASYAGWSLIEAMQDDAPERINLTIVAQPAIFAIQVGLVRLWRSWGVEPACVIGHSVGEVAAAWTAGALSLADAVKLVYHRSRLQGRTGGFGRMAAVGLTAQQGESLLSGYEGQLAVTAINSPSLITIGGNRDAMENVVAELERRDVFVRWLKLDYAFHTHQMDPIEEELKAALADLRPAAANIPFISSVTGELFDTQQLDGAYWWRNVREPVRFSAAIEAATARHASVFLEIGPHPSMRTSIESVVEDRPQTLALPSLSRHQDASTSLITSLARLHIHGGLVSGKPFGLNWEAINQASGEFVRQPAYAWNRQTFWLSTISESSRLAPPDHPLLQTRIRVAQPTWQTVLDPAVLTYLKDHQIWDAIVFPAAAYIEIGLAVAKVLFPDQKHQVEDLQLHAALFVSAEADTRLQVVYNSDDLTIQVHSSNDGINWDFNGQCRLVPNLSRQVPAKPLAVSQSTIVDIDDLVLDHDQLYEQLRQAGYGFGEMFSLIERLQFKRDETIAEIKVPETLHRFGAELNSGKNVFHPAILDACFQASLRVTSESSENASLFLPTSIGRVRLCREIDSETLIAVAHNFSTERD
ncbi:beta-ketoacyl synthase N-terminal-like domain-containing protein [Planctomycetaceae bacterium SH139]